jgi:hypothetical protein
MNSLYVLEVATENVDYDWERLRTVNEAMDIRIEVHKD